MHFNSSLRSIKKLLLLFFKTHLFVSLAFSPYYSALLILLAYSITFSASHQIFQVRNLRVVSDSFFSLCVVSFDFQIAHICFSLRPPFLLLLAMLRLPKESFCFYSCSLANSCLSVPLGAEESFYNKYNCYKLIPHRSGLVFQLCF